VEYVREGEKKEGKRVINITKKKKGSRNVPAKNRRESTEFYSDERRGGLWEEG